MAFGSWFKNLIGKAKGFISNKVIPAIKKGANVVASVAPTISKIGDAIGGDFGNVLNSIGSNAEKISNRLKGGTPMYGKPMLGVNGAGRFAVPLLK